MTSLLSVVVPIYNVAPYLEECLSSIAAQYHRELEVIMVDDGSTDDSGAIAARFAAADPRFRLITQANAGLGAARNAGAEAATGEWLMFVDSDDALPPYAAEVLIGSLTTTGSDFACGNVLRLTSRGLQQSPMHAGPFATTRLRTHVSRQPALLDDRTAWNKVFRRSFWQAHRLSFPEGVLYEDIPVIVPAHVLATAVDVLELPVYYWRQREGADRSITQRRDEVPALLDRIAGVSKVSAFLAERQLPRLKQSYDAAALRGDLMFFMRELPHVDDDYRRAFLDCCNAFLDTVSQRVIAQLPTPQRVLWTLVRRRMLPELLQILPTIRRRHAIVRRGLHRYHDLLFLDAGLPGLPRELFRAGKPRPRTRLHEVGWRDGKLWLRGHAYIPGEAAARPWSTLRFIWCADERGRRTRRIPLVTRRCDDVAAPGAGLSYAWSGFEAVIKPRSLRGADGRWSDGVWSVVMGVVGAGQRSQGPLEVGETATGVRLTGRDVDAGVRLTPVLTGRRLTLRVEHIHARLTGTELVDGEMQVNGELSATAPPIIAARLSRAPGVLWRSYPVQVVGRRFFFRIPLADLPGTDVPADPLRPREPADRWIVQLQGERAEPLPLAMAEGAASPPLYVETRMVLLHADEGAQPVLTVLPAGPLLTSITASATGAHLVGELPPGVYLPSLQLVLRSSATKPTWTFLATLSAGRWSVDLDVLGGADRTGVPRLDGGTWQLLCRIGTGPVVALPLGARALDSLPAVVVDQDPRVTLERRPGDSAVIRIQCRARAEDPVESAPTEGDPESATDVVFDQTSAVPGIAVGDRTG